MKLRTKSGRAVHSIGIGTWGFGGKREPEPAGDSAAVEAIRYSVSKGQNHIDTAEMYGGGHTDEVVGQAIAGLEREDLFIADKLWQDSVAASRVRPAVKAMLKKLGTDYLDALYIHYPWDDLPWREAIPQINELIDEGIVRYFGASNFNLDQLEEAIGLSQHPVVLAQVCFNVIYKQDAPEKLRQFCRSHDIQVVAYRPLERGAVLEDPIVEAIAKQHKVSPSQVALAWLIARQALPIPKATSRQNIDNNLGAMDVKLSPEDLARLDKL
jgi:diketogulonate reductase-like aldo/keto reductase